MTRIFSYLTLALISLPAFAWDISGTKILELSVDKETYAVGENALLHAQLLGKPENSDYEFDVVMKFNDVEISATRINEFDFFATKNNLEIGSQELKATVYIQDKKYANSLKNSVIFFQEKIDAAVEELADTTDPERIGELNAEIAKYTQLRDAANEQLNSIRSLVRTVTKTFQVN